MWKNLQLSNGRGVEFKCILFGRNTSFIIKFFLTCPSGKNRNIVLCDKGGTHFKEISSDVFYVHSTLATVNEILLVWTEIPYLSLFIHVMRVKFVDTKDYSKQYFTNFTARNVFSVLANITAY